eukprot:GHRQ01001305.1.p1 GENE.GHRQ01001305.1~~GHRQ01001305.1.p1  ORF type:complete len:390 (+),score=119.09 GHRQ01001305.1:648-1817(+)
MSNRCCSKFCHCVTCSWVMSAANTSPATPCFAAASASNENLLHVHGIVAALPRCCCNQPTCPKPSSHDVCFFLQGGGAYMYTSDSMLKRVHAMFQSKWTNRRLHMRQLGQQETRLDINHDVLYKKMRSNCHALYKRQKGVLQYGADGAPLDPQAGGNQQTTFSQDELVAMMDKLLASNSPEDAETMCMMLLMCSTAGRGDDCRERRICELMAPMLRKSIGPARAYVTAFVQQHGKTLGDTGGTRGCLRHKDALLDPQAALGRMLIQRFTLGGEAFPGPCAPELREIMLFPGRGSRQAVTYAGHKTRFSTLFKENDVNIKKKTHACRQYGARAADEAGLPDEVSPACGLLLLLLLLLNARQAMPPDDTNCMAYICCFDHAAQHLCMTPAR